MVGAPEAVRMFVGMWLVEAMQVLRDGGLEEDAGDLEGVCLRLKGEPARATGEGRGGLER